MSQFKTIFSGCLEFGNERSFFQVEKLFWHRTETYYRNDILLKDEAFFDEANNCFNIERFLTMSNLKSWRNTINLLEHIAEFAIAGHINAWRTEEGQMLETRLIEPQSDKAAVQAYLKGRDLIVQKGKEDEAMRSLNRAIEKFERHAMAYERRGHVNLLLKNYKDAMYDFSKSIDIYPHNPEPYLGRAYLYQREGAYEKAIADLTLATKCSIPHQPIYWEARRKKAEYFLAINDFESAIKELRLFIKRKFTSDNPNYKYRRPAFSALGRALFETQQYKEAIQAFDTAMAIDEQQATTTIPVADQLFYRGMARQKIGQKGYEADLEEAADLGCTRAAKQLQAMA